MGHRRGIPTGGYRSKFEARVARDLEEAGCAFEYEVETFPYVLTSTYTPDFFLDSGVIIEAKGRFDPDARKKHLAIRTQYPDLDIRLLFQRDNRLSKTSKLRYSDWCRRSGIKFAVGKIPDNWF